MYLTETCHDIMSHPKFPGILKLFLNYTLLSGQHATRPAYISARQ